MRLRLLALAGVLAGAWGATTEPPAPAPASTATAQLAWVPVLAEVTAYCPCSLCCPGTADGITADGTRVARVPYNLAADRSLLLGTAVWVPLGHGVLDRVRHDDRVFHVDDRGGALDTEAVGILRLDLRVKEHWWAKQFGRKRILVYIGTK